MATKSLPSRITGDVDVVTDVTVSMKGGSLTAILRKVLRERLGKIGTKLSAAALDLGDGQGLVLLSPGAGGPSIHIQRTGAHRFEIDLCSDEDEEVDEITAAFLRLKVDQFAKDGLDLSEPISAKEWRQEMDAKLRDTSADSATSAKANPEAA